MYGTIVLIRNPQNSTGNDKGPHIIPLWLPVPCLLNRKGGIGQLVHRTSACCTLAERSREYLNDYVGVSENRGPYYSTLNSRILIIRTPK